MLDFAFQHAPFDVTPDPRMVFRHARFAEAVEALQRGLDGGKGFLVFTGEVGAGKTTLLRTYLAEARPHLETAVILNSGLAADELLLAIAEDLGLACGTSPSRKAILDLIQGHVLDVFASGRRTVVFIDEAQNLDIQALELVRMLSNIETDTDKLLQLVLFGQDSLREMLARPELFQLRSRIAVHRHLRPLEEADTAAYVLHRLAEAAPRKPVTFSPAALRRLHGHARGLPRLINILAAEALRFAGESDCMIVDERHIERAVDEFADLDPEGSRAAISSTSTHPLPTTRPQEDDAGTANHPARSRDGEGIPYAAIAAWLLALALIGLIAVRAWERFRPVPFATPVARDLPLPAPVSPLGTPAPATETETEAATPDIGAWDPVLVRAFFAASGLVTAYEPTSDQLADPISFAAAAGRILAPVPADSRVLSALGVPAIVPGAPAPSDTALPTPGRLESPRGLTTPRVRAAPAVIVLRPVGPDRVEAQTASERFITSWNALPGPLAPEAFVLLPSGLEVLSVTERSDERLIRTLQRALFEAGHLAGPITGRVDSATRAAVEDLQRVQGLPITATADAPTLITLHKLRVWIP